MADTEAGVRSGRWRRLLPPVTTVLAVVALWSVLVAPDRLFRLTPAAFLRIPLEALVLVGLTLLLPPRRVRSVAAALGAVIGLLAVVRVLDLGFQEVLHRPFNPVNDWRLVGPAVDMVGESFGEGWARAAVVGVVLVLIALSAALTLAVIRVCGVAARRRRVTARTVGSLGVVWLVCVVLGVQLTPGVPVASRETAELAVVHVRDAARDLGDVSVFRAQVTAEDPWRTVPAEELLTGLRGKDVLIVFVESYGRVAVQGSSFSPDIRDLLAAGTDRLRAAGFSARSGFLTSPTFAGLSWLAHATLHSGLWIGTQQRHDRLLESDRFTLAGAFGRAGWRTVVDVPSNRDPWDEGRAFYGFDADHDRHDVGYEGPKFGFAAVPDQYTLAAFERMELGPGHAPVMAEIDLVSSHEPWTPLPRMLDWGELGDGSAYRGMPAEGPAPAAVLGDTDRIRALYAESIRYALTAVISFVTTVHEEDDDLVVLLIGDHQPASIITGPDASHDVPITMIAGDPAVLDHITSWGWDDGMLPGPNAPLWRMDAFRDRFLTAFSAAPIPAPAQVLSE